MRAGRSPSMRALRVGALLIVWGLGLGDALLRG
jgi:hypothetical protein